MKNSGPASSTNASQCDYSLLSLSHNSFPKDNGYLDILGSHIEEQELPSSILGACVEGILVFFGITCINAGIPKKLNQ